MFTSLHAFFTLKVTQMKQVAVAKETKIVNDNKGDSGGSADGNDDNDDGSSVDTGNYTVATQKDH